MTHLLLALLISKNITCKENIYSTYASIYYKYSDYKFRHFAVSCGSCHPALYSGKSSNRMCQELENEMPHKKTVSPLDPRQRHLILHNFKHERTSAIFEAFSPYSKPILSPPPPNTHTQTLPPAPLLRVCDWTAVETL